MSNFIETTEIDYEKLFTIFNNIDKTNSKYKNFKMKNPNKKINLNMNINIKKENFLGNKIPVFYTNLIKILKKKINFKSLHNKRSK